MTTLEVSSYFRYKKKLKDEVFSLKYLLAGCDKHVTNFASDAVRHEIFAGVLLRSFFAFRGNKFSRLYRWEQIFADLGFSRTVLVHNNKEI